MTFYAKTSITAALLGFVTLSACVADDPEYQAEKAAMRANASKTNSQTAQAEFGPLMPICLAAIGLRASPHQLRNQNRIQDTTDDDGVDIVWQLVCNSKGVGCVGSDTDCSRDQYRTDKTEDPGNNGPRGHDY